MDSDAAEDDVRDALRRILDRKVALAAEISPGLMLDRAEDHVADELEGNVAAQIAARDAIPNDLHYFLGDALVDLIDAHRPKVWVRAQFHKHKATERGLPAHQGKIVPDHMEKPLAYRAFHTGRLFPGQEFLEPDLGDLDQ